MFWNKGKLEEKVSSTLYDLTHLEINTIIKDEMSASKAPASARLLLHALAVTYHEKLVSLGEKYTGFPGMPATENNLFRGVIEFAGSGHDSFKELHERAGSACGQIRENTDTIPFTDDIKNSDCLMLRRIEAISDDVRRILKIEGVDPYLHNKEFNFDDPETVKTFRSMPASKADEYELRLDLRQLLVIKKANDIGTEKVVLQTVIGMDGDITTRISKSFAEQPVTFINQIHHEAIIISVDFWKTLINVVVKLGESILGLKTPKAPKE